MATRALDGRRLVAAFRNASGKRIPIPASLPIAAGDKAEVDNTINDWLVQHDTLFSLPQPNAPDAWNPERLEYGFSVGGAPGDEEIPFTAAQYAEGHLDWHSVDYDPEISLVAAADRATTPVVRTVMPAPVTFRGAPRAALLGDGGCGDRLWLAAGGPWRLASPDAERARDGLRQ